MVWQDIVVAAANAVFWYSLIYQIYKGFVDKIGALTFQTSLLTSLGLYAIAFSFFTLGLYLSAIATFVTGLLWTILLVQRIIYKKHRK